MNKILGIVLVIVVIISGKMIYDTHRAYKYLEAKTRWCYDQNGIMIEVHCFSKDMKLIEIPLDYILNY